MSLREAAEKALEALEYAARCAAMVECSNAAEALRTALAEADEPVEMQDIGPEWRPCVKLPVTVHVRAQRPGEGHISTREGITPCRPDDLIMRGVAGEEYPISRALFERTYVVGDATLAEADEPVAWMDADGNTISHAIKGTLLPTFAALYPVPLYIHPPHREPLTEEELFDIYDEGGWQVAIGDFRHIAHAIERAHGIGTDE